MTTQATLLHTHDEGDLRISVHDHGTKRWLEFGDGGIQSIIDRQKPNELVSPLNQTMLAALLFMPAPAYFLLLGVGGAAIARYLSHRQPDCQGDAVELSSAIVDIARQFFEFPEQNWQMHHTDAQNFVSETKNAVQHYDYIVADIAEQQHTPHWLTEPAFLDHCRQRLSSRGVLCLNLMPRDAADFTQQLSRIRLAFDARTVCLSVPEHRNILVFAFTQRPKFDDIAQLRQSASDLTQHWGLPFDDLLTRMIQDNPVGSGVF